MATKNEKIFGVSVSTKDILDGWFDVEEQKNAKIKILVSFIQNFLMLKQVKTEGENLLWRTENSTFDAFITYKEKTESSEFNKFTGVVVSLDIFSEAYPRFKISYYDNGILSREDGPAVESFCIVRYSHLELEDEFWVLSGELYGLYFGDKIEDIPFLKNEIVLAIEEKRSSFYKLKLLDSENIRNINIRLKTKFSLLPVKWKFSPSF